MIVDYRKRRTEHVPIFIDGAVVEQVWELQVPWCPHHLQTRIVQTHHDSREEGTTKPISPQETKKIWHGSWDPQKVPQLQHREHPGCITAWYGNCSASDCKALQRVVRTAQFNYTLMYILTQLAQPTSAPAHWLTWLSALCPATQHPPTPLIRHCYSLFIIYA